MTDSRLPVFALLCLAGVLVALPVAGAASADGAATGLANDTGAQANNNSTMGAEISAFMQSSASEADGSVDDGMFEARYADDGTDRDALVRNRTDRLRSDLERLRAEKRALQAEKGNLSRVEYQARMSRLVGEIRSLERSANRTEPLAESAGVDPTALAEVRANASALPGSEASALASSLAVVPEHVDRGPSDNRTAGPPDDRAGPGGNGDETAENGSDGPPDDRGAGQEDGGGQDDGAGGDATSGNEGNSGGGGSGNGNGGPKAAAMPR
jgi:hypothetical protein